MSILRRDFLTGFLATLPFTKKGHPHEPKDLLVSMSGPDSFGVKLSNAIGMKGRYTQGIIIHSPVNGVVTATVTIPLSNLQGEKVLTLMSGHTFVEQDVDHERYVNQLGGPARALSPSKAGGALERPEIDSSLRNIGESLPTLGEKFIKYATEGK